MPFSELTRMANVDTTHQNLTYLSTDLSFGGGDNDNFELEWGNSEIMMQDQSCRVAFKDGKDAKHSKMGMFCRIDSVLNDFPLSAPSIEMELDEDDDDSPPWPNFDNEHPFECLHELEFAGNELKTPVGCSSLKQHKLAPTQPSSSSGFRNVPYFSRLASLSDLDLAKGSDSEPLRVKDCKNGDENIPEPAVAAASSVCSAKSLERASNDVLACELKRKCHDNEDDESVGVSKTGSKRSRAASVHNNLPERIKWRQRRKDRVNKKMRELQELIPNCNKADKASLLDETIEYLKTLQLQLQILSMGTGMYMSPMMLQATMQQVHRAYVPTFYNMTPMQNFQVPNNQISSPMFHGSIGCSQQHARYPGQEQRMSMPCIPLPIFAAMPNSLMNDKSYLGTDFGKDQYQAVNSAGKGRNPGVAPRNCSSK